VVQNFGMLCQGDCFVTSQFAAVQHADVLCSMAITDYTYVPALCGYCCVLCRSPPD
jgi:hypothetical protein